MHDKSSSINPLLNSQSNFVVLTANESCFWKSNAQIVPLSDILAERCFAWSVFINRVKPLWFARARWAVTYPLLKNASRIDGHGTADRSHTVQRLS